MRLVPSLLILAAGLSAAETAEALPLVVVTADRTENPITRTTATIDVIDEADARERGHPDQVWQLLSGTPGVDLTGAGGIDGGTVGIRLRGSNSYDTKLLLDGIPVTDPSTTQGQGNIAYLDPVGIERIEIVRGPQSGLYGSDAVGGVVNVLTARPTAVPAIAGRAEGGSFGTARLEGTATGPLGDAAGYALSVGGLHSNGITVRTDPGANGRTNGNEADSVDRLSANARIEVRPIEAAVLYVAVRGDAADQEYDGYTPAFTVDPNDDDSREKFRSLRTATGGAIRAGITKTSLDIARTRSTRTYDEEGATDNVYRGTGDFAALHSEAAVVKPATGRGWSPDRLDLGLGVDWRRDRAEIDAFGATGDESERQTGVYGQVLAGDRYLEFSQAARVDQHTREGRNATWRSGLAAFPVDDVKLHGSVGTGFRAPSLYELRDPFSGNPDLEAQRSRSYDLGHETHLPGNLTLGNVAFRTDYTQDIQYVPVGFAGNYQNTGGYRVEGVESSLAWKPDAVGPRLLASWTWQRTDLADEDVTAGRGFTGLPRNKLMVQPAWYLQRLWASVTVYGIGRRLGFGGELPGYATVGAAVGYTLSSHWEVYARGENLTNTAYEVNPGYATPNMSGYGGVTATF